MNISFSPRKSLIAAAVASALLTACSSAPTRPEGADNVRSKLTRLQSDPELASRAPLAIRDAERAVNAAEQPEADKAVAAHLVFVADRKVDTARALAESRLAVDQRKTLAEEREAMRLQARTQEADAANRRAEVARDAATDAKRETDAARGQADLARDATANAQRETDLARSQGELDRVAAANAQRSADELQAQIKELQAKKTDRGLVLTLGDVLFASGTAKLNLGANANLGKLAAFLNKYPERNTVIEGYTDNVGTEEYNQGLSERRANAVKAYLVEHGVAASRVTTSGKGESSPVGDNSSASGRQQNRRVEVVIENEVAAT